MRFLDGSVYDNNSEIKELKRQRTGLVQDYNGAVYSKNLDIARKIGVILENVQKKIEAARLAEAVFTKYQFEN